MADEGGEKTEMPTEKKLRDAREKGQVCQSKDVSTSAVLIVMLALAGAFGVSMTIEMADLMRFIGQRTGMREINHNECLIQAVMLVMKYSFMFALVAATIGVIACLVQVGILFSFESLKPNLSKMNPISAAKRIFSKKNLFEFLKNILKLSFLGYLIYKIVWRAIPILLPMCYGTIDDIFPILSDLLKSMAQYTAFGYIVIAVVDWVIQKQLYMKEMMMSKDEVKREYKEMEGSQEVKQAQRDFRNELLNGPDPQTATKKASVVVTNPTHLAIGIRYNLEEAPLPKVVIAGAGHIAKVIRETAMREGIPIMENVPLAWALYEKVKIDDFIPVELAEPVAEVLKLVKKLDDAQKEQDELDSIQL